MALLAAGEVEAAERAYAWVPTVQRADGSVPLKIVGGRGRGRQRRDQHVVLPRGRGVAPLAGPPRPRRSYVGTGRSSGRGLDFAVSMQLPWGGIAWSQEWRDGRPAGVNREALLAGSSSIHHALRAGVALAELVDDPQPEWELAGGRLAHAVREHRGPVPRQVRVLDGLVLPGARRRGPRRGGPRRCSTRGGTPSWSPGSASAASAATPGSPARRPASWCSPSTRSATASARCGCSPTCSTCGTRTAPTGPATSSPRTSTGRTSSTTYTAAAMILAVDALSLTTPGATIMRGHDPAAVRGDRPGVRLRVSRPALRPLLTSAPAPASSRAPRPR